MLLSHMIRCFVFVWIADTIVWSQVDEPNPSEAQGLIDSFVEGSSEMVPYNFTSASGEITTIASQPTTASTMETQEPSAPLFNVTPTSMTSMKVEWQPVEGSFDYYTIESEDDNTLPTVVVNKSETSYEYQDLLPYSEYNVYVYSVVINQDGNEVKSPSQPQNVLIYYEEFCEKEQLEHPGDKELVTFPRTRAGYSNTTLETCLSKDGSPTGGSPYGTRSCTIDAIWNPPAWISSCEITLEDLTEVNITNNEEREEVASDLTVLTSNSSSLSSESIQQSASALESIVDTEELEQNTTTLVIKSLGNLLAAPEEKLQESGVQDRLLATLDEVSTKVVLNEGEEYQSTTSTLSIAVAQIDIASGFSGIGYQENKNPSSESLGFSEGQFQTFNSTLKDQNSTSIYLPESVVSNSEDGRVSFYAFADNKIFQVSESNSSNVEDDVIEYDATIQSKIILSASIQGPDQNLTKNVTIIFEYNQFVCPNDDNDDSCGEYLCGFWDEEQSVWSQSGCILTRMSENIIECQCNHLTNFANLFASSEYFESNILNILTYVCCSISLLGSLLTIIFLIYVSCTKSPVIYNTTTFIMINLASALTLLNGFLLISNLNEVIKNKDACTAIAVLLHFSLFATLLWTTVEASSVCLAIVAPIYYRANVSEKKTILYTGIVGWGIPSIFVGLTAGIKLSWYQQLNDSTQTCWITVEKVTYIVIIPASIIIVINTILYIVTIITYFRRKQVGSQNRVKISTGKSIIFSLSLFLIFGISWIFGFLLFGSDEFSEVFAYIFTIATGLQGLFLFLLFVVRNKKVAQNIRSKLDWIRSNVLPTKTSTYTIQHKNKKGSKQSSSNSYPETFTLYGQTSDVTQ